MAQATTRLSYQLVIHESALGELNTLPEVQRTNLKAKAREASRMQEPSNHSCISPLRDSNGIMRIRDGRFRALADLDIPQFRLLLIDHRERVYERIQEAKARQEH